MNFSSVNSLWDITSTQPPSQFSHLPDNDFLALLQKQFPTTNTNDSNNDSPDSTVDPPSARRPPPSHVTPPSDDSSPSSPNSTSRRQSLHSPLNDTDEPALKRKASDDDLDPGPSSKNQHTADDTNLAKRQLPSRRKSTGNPQQDESRLLKRKEQNRAAQRAFRERKEKHVKDLEDKVAALEAKNEATETENSNLRDLLSRLQQENLALKQAQFTFSVPKPAPVPTPTQNTTVQQSPFSFFGTPSPFPPSGLSQTSSNSLAFGSNVDWSALTTFDPSVLKILDEPQEVPMQTDPTPSPYGQYALPQSYKTIANNPLLMSFIDETPASQTTNTTATPNSSLDHFTFNFPSSTNSWTSAAQSSSFSQNQAQNDFLHPNHSLDELFGGNFMNNQSPLDFHALVDSTSMSPIAHANGAKPCPPSQQPLTSPLSNSNNSPPSSASTSTSQSPFSWRTVSQAGESPPSASESTPSGNNPSGTRSIVFSRQDMAKHIAAGGPSPFADLANPVLRKMSDAVTGEVVGCQGSNFPRTKESPDNIEVLKAWRSITQDPRFKDVDINELCADLARKARCDGTKVVLEPEGVHQIYERLTQPQRPSSPQEQR